MPIGKILVEDLVEPCRMLGVGDIQQDAVTRTGPCCEANLRKHRDVVALVRGAGALRALAVRAAHPEAGNIAGGGIGEDARRLTIFASAGLASGTLITSMLKSAVLGSSFGSLPEQPSSSWADRTGEVPDPVDVDAAGIARVWYERVGVRSPAGLDCSNLSRLRDIGDVEDTHAAEPLAAHLGPGGPAFRNRAVPRPCSTDMNSRFL
jgi:hypothetical protein